MTTIGLQPISLKAAVFTVAADDYTASVNEVTFTPEVEWAWENLLDADADEPGFLRARWTAVIGYAQDLTTAGAFTLYLLGNAGERKTVAFTPVAGGPTVEADVLILPGPMGGPSGQILTGTVALPLFGAPVVDGGS